MPEIIVGTYEDYVVGYQILEEHRSVSSKLYSFEQSFAIRAHSGSVRCLATSADGSLALSCGVDEMINLFGLKKRKLLQTSEMAVNCATFVKNSHIICGLEDGDIYIYECKSSATTLVKTLKGHKMAITSISLHPSGKVLLSLSKDNTMRTWNLIKGRCAYVTNIKSQAHLVCWSRTGDEFLVAADNEIYLYNNSGSQKHHIKLDKRINSIEFITGNIFVVASDSRNLEFFDAKEGDSLLKFEAHETRVKSIRFIDGDDDNDGKQSVARFVTASSDGMIKLWLADISSSKLEKPQELTSVDTGVRLTCMTSAYFPYFLPTLALT